jgi:multiple sugar transport system permease protein
MIRMGATIAHDASQVDVAAAPRFRAGVLARRFVLYVVLIGGSLIFILPLVWLVSTSLKPDTQVFRYPPEWIPRPIQLANYADAWDYANFTVYMRNTVYITVLSVLGRTVSACFVAYGFARLRFPGRNQLFLLVLATLMLPEIVLLIPQFVEFRIFGWINSFSPLIVPTWFGGGAFYIFLLRQFFLTIPMELSDAAKIDGAGDLAILTRIIVPLSKPALATVAIFAFMGAWNDFMGPLIYLNSDKNWTMTLGLQHFIQTHTTQWTYLMAISTLMVIPVILVFFFAQKQFIQGVVLTGSKG